VDIKNRKELAEYAGSLGYKKSAEIGVYNGKYSLVICQSFPELQKHFCVDTWLPSRNHRWQRRLDAAYVKAQRILKDYPVEFLRMTSLEAAKKFKRDELDFVYIDALHDAWNVMHDLKAWYPIVRSGGMVSGHDWGHAGVSRGLRLFEMQIQDNFTIQHTDLDGGDPMPSWYFIKE